MEYVEVGHGSQATLSKGAVAIGVGRRGGNHKASGFCGGGLHDRTRIQQTYRLQRE